MLKVGIIGCGFMGGMHAACYNVIEGAQLVAVADVRSEKAQEFADKYGATAYADGEDLIANADVDIIDICLPTFLHAKHAELAMKKGVNVFLEKPACLTSEEGEKLIALQKETGAKVQIGQVVRFSDEYIWLKEQLDNNTYGKIKSAVFTRLSSSPAWGWEDWLHNPDRSGTVALDMHVHDIDFIRYILGEPDDIVAKADRNADGVIEQIFATLKFGDATVTAEGCWDYPQDFPFEESFCVKFEKATVVYNCNSGINVYPNEGGHFSPEMVRAFEGTNDIGGNLSDLGGYYNELKYFVDSINDASLPEIAPLREGVKSVNLSLKEIELAGGTRI